MADDDRPTDGQPSQEPHEEEEPADEPSDVGDTQAWQPEDDEPTQAWTPDETGRTQVWQLDQTAALPIGAHPDPADTTAEPQAASWSGRAQVPTPGSGAHGLPEEPWEPEETGGSWWLPVVVAAIALVILGVLGIGIWLIADALREEQAVAPTPSPTPTFTPTPTPTPQAPPAPTPEATPPPPEPTPTPTPEPTPTPTPEPTPTPTESPGGVLPPLLPGG